MPASSPFLPIKRSKVENFHISSSDEFALAVVAVVVVAIALTKWSETILLILSRKSNLKMHAF